MKASTKTSTAKKQQQPQQQQQRQHVPAHVVIRAPEHGGAKMKGVPAVQVGDARLSSMLEQCCSMMTSFVSVDGMMQDKDMPPTSSGMGHAMLRMMMKEQHDDAGMMQGKDMLPPVMRQMMGRSDVEPPASSMEMLCQQMARKLLSDGIARQMLAECGMVTPSCSSSDDVTDRWLQMMMTTMSSTSVSPTGAGTDPLMQQMMMTMKAGGSEAWQQMMKSPSVSLPGGMKEMLSSSERPGEVEGVMALCMACCVGMCCTMGQTLTEVLPCLLTEEKEETSPSSTEAMGGLAGCMAVLLSCCSTIESLCRDESRRRMMQKDPKTMANCAAMMRAIMSCCACLAATCCRMENDRSRKPCAVPDPACPKETVMVDCLPPAAQLLCCMTTACAMGCAGMMASCLVMCCPPSSTMHPEWTHQSMTECGMMCCSMVCCSQMMERIRHLMTLPSLRDEPAAAECCLRCCCSVSTAMASCCGIVTTVLTACDPPLRSTAEQEPRPWAMVAPVMSCMLSCCGMMAELQSMPCVMQRVCGSPSSMSLMACGTAACLSACCDLALDEGVRAAAASQPALSRSLLCCVAGGCLVVDTLRECVMANEITRGDSLLCCMLGCLTSCCSLLCTRMNKMSSSSSVDNEAERCLACCAALDDMLSQRMQQRGGGRTKEKAAKDKSCESTNRGMPASMISTVAVCCSLGCRLVLKEQPCKAPQVEMRMQSILSSCCELLVRDTRSCDPPMSSEGCCVDECMAVCMASCMLSPCCVLPETVVSRVGLPEEDLPCLASACSMLACCRAMKDVIPMLCDGRPPRKDSASGGPPGLLTKRSMVAMVVCCCSCMALCQGLCVTARCTPSAGSTMSSGMAVPNCMAGCCGMMEEALEEACRSIQMHGVEEMDCVMPLQCVGVVCCSLSACLCTMAPCCGVPTLECCDMQKSTIRCCDSLCQMMAQMCCISHPQKSIGMGTAGCLLRVTATVCSGMGCLMTALCSQNATSTCASSMMRMAMAPAGGHTVSLSQMECSPASLEVLKMLPSTCQAICRRMQEAALLCVEVQGGAGRDVTEMMAMCCSMGMLSLTCCCMCCGLQRDACQVGRAMAEMDMADARLCQQMEEAMEQALHCCTMMQRSAKELLSVSVPAHSRDLVIAMAAACCGCSSAISGRMACLPVSMAAGTCGSDTAMACMAAMMRQPRSAMKKSMLRMKACMQSMLQGCLEVELGLSCALAERQSRLQLDDVKEKGSAMMMTELCSGCHSIGMQCCGMGMMAMCSLGSCCGIPSMLMNRAMPKEDCRLMMRAMMDCCVPSPECLLRVIEEMACCCKGMMDASFMACCMGGQVMPSVALCGMCGMLSAVGCAMTCGCRMRCLMKGMPMSERIVCRKAHLEAASLIDCCKKDMDRMTSMVMPQPRQGLPRETLVACLCAVDQICCAPAGMMPSTGVGVMGHRVAVKRREQEKHRAEELLRESCQSAQEGMKKGCNLLMNRCQMVGAIPGMVQIEKEKEAEISVRKAMGTCGEKMRECCAEGMRHCIKVATKEDASSLAACVDALCAQECKDHGVPRGKAHQMSRTIH